MVDRGALPIWRAMAAQLQLMVIMGMWPSLAKSTDVSREARNLDFENVSSTLKNSMCGANKNILKLNMAQEQSVYNLWSRIKEQLTLANTPYPPTCYQSS